MIDSGDTGFMIICTALVLLMTPGLALAEWLEEKMWLIR